MSRILTGKNRPPGRAAPVKARSEQSAASERRALRLETLARVAAVLGHESSNLLGALGTCAQVLRRNPHLTVDDLEMLDIIQTGAQRLHEIIGQFAMFRRAGAARTPVNLNALMEEILTRLRQHECCSAEIAIERRFDPRVRVITADVEGLRRALWELCLNGAQAIGKRGTLEIWTRRTGRKIVIRVSDSGRGIDPGLAQDIFEPLFTTRTRATGLGLAIVKRVIEDHGGSVVLAEGARQPGATFVITLPTAQSKQKQPRPREDEVHG